MAKKTARVAQALVGRKARRKVAVLPASAAKPVMKPLNARGVTSRVKPGVKSSANSRLKPSTKPSTKPRTKALARPSKPAARGERKKAKPAGVARVAYAAAASALRGADLLSLSEVTPAQVLALYATAAASKANMKAFRHVLDGKTVVLLFEKASLRTRISFETGIGKLGGTALYMDHSAQRIGEREATKDYGRNLERWIDCIVARVYSQRTVEELAAHSDVPVINALSDRFHPCQGLADMFTLWERPGGLDGLRLAWVGDGNNVCHSLMHAATLLGVDMTVVTPRGYEPAEDVVEQCLGYAKDAGSMLTFAHDPQAVEGHHAVYTDVWVSMGQTDQANERRAAFADFTVTADMMQLASRGVTDRTRFPHGSLFMHCLPAQRGVEVMDEVIDAPSSVVYDQAENRMHAQNALLIHIFGGP